MPIYEYDCMDCGHRFELNRKIDDRDKPAKCPKCGAKRVNRAFGSFTTTNFRSVYFKSQVEGVKPREKVHLGYQTKSTRWGHSKPVRPIGKE